MNRIRIFSLIAAFTLLFTCMGFNPARAGEELFLYSGAGLRQPVDELVGKFQKTHNLAVKIEYAGSGQLMTRYLASGRGDVFLPGSHFYVDKLKQKGRIAWSRPTVMHVPVVAFRKNGEKKITGFGDLAKPGVRVGLGDPKSMALGRTAEAILKSSGIGPLVRKNIAVRAATVKQLTLYAIKGDVDAAIIARADVVQSKGKLGMIPINRKWYRPEIVTSAVFSTSGQMKAAQSLAEFLSSPYAVKVFERYGFLATR